jgi:hypothetical protein
MGGRVGGAQMHRLAAPDQPDGQRRGQCGLAHPALAHDHDESVFRLRQCIGQSGQIRQCLRWRRRGSDLCGTSGKSGPAGASRARSAGKPTVSNGRRGTWSCGRLRRASGMPARAAAAHLFNGHGDPVGPVTRLEHPIDHQALVLQAQRMQLYRRPGRLSQCTDIGTCHQNDGGPFRVAQCGQCSLEARLLRLQPRMRPQTGSTPVIAAEESTPGLGAGSTAAGCAQWVRCQTRHGPMPDPLLPATRQIRRTMRSRWCRHPTAARARLARSASVDFASRPARTRSR